MLLHQLFLHASHAHHSPTLPLCVCPLTSFRRVLGGVPLSLYSGADSKAAWSALSARLKAWKHNLHTVLTTLTLSQQMQEQESAEEMQ